jgi:decaprenyl-phosphate phosphoribosyltransferase
MAAGAKVKNPRRSAQGNILLPGGGNQRPGQGERGSEPIRLAQGGRVEHGLLSRPTTADAIAAPRRSPLASGRTMLRALRPRQWPKNLLVFAAPGAAGILFGPDVLERTGAAFVVFCVLASAAYLVNDVADAEQDRRHPTKRCRPVAAGAVSEPAALAVAGVFLAVAIGLSVALGPAFLLSALGYAVVTVAYSLGLKRVAVVDLMLVASCYVLRAVAGAAAVHIEPSTWFLALVTASAIAVVAGRRIADLRDPTAAAADRPRSAVYTLEYLRGIWILGLGIAVTTYCLWAIAVPHDSHGIAWSQLSIVPFALALLRYAYVLERGEAGEPEEVFASDRVVQLAVAAWFIVYGLGVYVR